MPQIELRSIERVFTLGDSEVHALRTLDLAVEAGEYIDPYAAESPAEFFAVLAEVFFADPLCFRREYRGLYELYVQFFRQDPAARVAARAGSERAPPARG